MSLTSPELHRHRLLDPHRIGGAKLSPPSAYPVSSTPISNSPQNAYSPGKRLKEILEVRFCARKFQSKQPFRTRRPPVCLKLTISTPAPWPPSTLLTCAASICIVHSICICFRKQSSRAERDIYLTYICTSTLKTLYRPSSFFELTSSTLQIYSVLIVFLVTSSFQNSLLLVEMPGGITWRLSGSFPSHTSVLASGREVSSHLQNTNESHFVCAVSINGINASLCRKQNQDALILQVRDKHLVYVKLRWLLGTLKFSGTKANLQNLFHAFSRTICVVLGPIAYRVM